MNTYFPLGHGGFNAEGFLAERLGEAMGEGGENGEDTDLVPKGWNAVGKLRPRETLRQHRECVAFTAELFLSADYGLGK